ncbi:phycobilisome rod-core linker polypeptide [Cyanobium sp. CH-040]|uniref:phycobilisome rod-core linker polypeptide n=1 Tax=Cyanobium sp. CH-040 TaxID=2823708 RepID=UPI0020CD3DAD|nr:phycobilisome rod-core linker polypeptide [Cyanobium sp. CH-040]MCP9929054.1 phycobilisome rod-core linker polypeptide [Cyanobium sp. CH-040]
MALLKAPVLGIERYANDRDKENWAQASSEDRNTIIRAVYQQVLGHQYLMKSERLDGLESLFRNGDLTVREFVRQVAKSGLYKARFFENCNPYRFIELNFKHLLGRAPQNGAEMLHHFTILQEQGYDAEIDSYLDSDEYQERFGQDVVPYIHGWDYSKGHEGRQFSWLMQLARGAAASVKGDAAGVQSRLNKVVHTNRPIAVNPPSSGPAFFRSAIGTGVYDGELGTSVAVFNSDRSDRVAGLPVMAGTRSSDGASGRLVTILVTGVADNAYSRTAETVIRVPFTRMNEALQRVGRLGGRVVEVRVS